MKKFFTLIFAAFASGVFAAELTLDSQRNIVPDTGNGGTLRLEGKFAPQDISTWFFADFTDASGKSLGKFRFDREKLLMQPGYWTAGYPAETTGEKFFHLTIELSSTGTAFVVLNGRPLTTYAFAENLLPKKITLIPFGSFVPVFQKTEWDGKVPSQRIQVRSERSRNTGISAIAGMKTESFELKYKFRAEPLTEKPGHFNLSFISVKKGVPPVQLIFWKKGFQMIFGKSSKWLFDFKTPVSDGKWHDFRVRHTGGDFWEVYLDGQSAGSFEADSVISGIAFGAYDGWLFEVENVTLLPLAEEGE